MKHFALALLIAVFIAALLVAQMPAVPAQGAHHPIVISAPCLQNCGGGSTGTPIPPATACTDCRVIHNHIHH